MHVGSQGDSVSLICSQAVAEHCGEVRRLNSSFSFFAGDDFFGENIRVSAALEPMGCIGDLGWYGTLPPFVFPLPSVLSR